MKNAEPKLTWRKDLPLSHGDVAPIVDDALTDLYATVMVRQANGKPSHLKLRRARDGRLYVRYGRRGSGKGFIDRCDVTYFDGLPGLHVFRFERSSWEIQEETRRSEADRDEK